MLTKLLLRQPLHIIQSLSIVSKLEISFIGITLYAYLTERLYYLILQWKNFELLHLIQTRSVVSSIHIILFLMAAPFIFRRLIPRQKTLLPFYSLPLENKDVITVGAYYFFKYLLIIPLFFSPLLSALILLDALSGIYTLFIIIFAAVTIFFTGLFDLNVSSEKSLIYKRTIIYLFIYILFVIVNLFIFKSTLPVNFIFFSGLLFLTYFKFKKNSCLYIDIILPFNQNRPVGNTKIKNRISLFSRIFNNSLRILFNKELLSLWRNPGYKRVKLFATTIYILFLTVVILRSLHNPENWILAASLITAWLHYGNHFSDKYVSTDPAWYFHTLPLKYSIVWTAKFLAEFIYIIFVALIQSLFLLIAQASPQIVFSFGALLFGFAVLTIAVKLNFQILYYDSPRAAGYAYHFTLLFIVIMSINYRLVGPLIGFILLLNYFYKSYRFLKD